MYWYHTSKQKAPGGGMTIWAKAKTIGEIQNTLIRHAKHWPEDFENGVTVRVGKKRRDGLGFKTHAYYTFKDDKLIKEDWTDLSHWLAL